MLFIGEVELQRYEPLPSAVLQVFDSVLVTRIVGDHQQKPIGGINHDSQLVDSERASVVREWMNYDRGVLPRLNNLVKVADSARLDSARQWAVLPPCARGIQQVPADQVGRSQVFVACHRNQREILRGVAISRAA